MIEVVLAALVFFAFGYSIGLIVGQQQGYDEAQDPNHEPEKWGY